MRLGVLSFMLGLGLVLSVQQTALAQEEEKERKTSVKSPIDTPSESSFFSRLRPKLSILYLGVYRGSPLNDITGSYQPAPTGGLDFTAPQSVENLLTLGYKLDPDWVTGVIGHFYYFPIGNPAGSGHDIQMWDPILFLSK